MLSCDGCLWDVGASTGRGTKKDSGRIFLPVALLEASQPEGSTAEGTFLGGQVPGRTLLLRVRPDSLGILIP